MIWPFHQNYTQQDNKSMIEEVVNNKNWFKVQTSFNLLRMTENLRVDQVNMKNEERTTSPTSSSDLPTPKRKCVVWTEYLL